MLYNGCRESKKKKTVLFGAVFFLPFYFNIVTQYISIFLYYVTILTRLDQLWVIILTRFFINKTNEIIILTQL